LSIFNDVDLCKGVDRKIEEYYVGALRYEHSIPDYALIQYRKAAECACDILIRHYEQPFSEKNSLWKKIKFLSDSGYINEELKQTLNAIRENANNGAHHAKDETGNFDNKNLISERLNQTRECLLSCLAIIFKIITGNHVTEIMATQVSSQKNSEIILEAMTSTDWNTHYRAGLCYEELLTDDIIARGKLLNNKEQTFELLMSYYRSAANSYETAFRLSCEHCSEPPYESNAFSHVSGQLDGCEFEPLYKYCQVLLTSGVLEGQIPTALQLLEVAAESEHGKSCGLLGNYLYDDGQYFRALYFLEKAAEQLDDAGLCGLFFYYSDGKAITADYNKALHYLELGLAQGSVQCTGVLGGAYFNGTGVVMDRNKGVELAKQAMQKGSLQAYHFVKEVELNAMKDFYMSTQSMPIATTTVGRNDACPCGSGKKYKKCCLVKGATN